MAETQIETHLDVLLKESQGPKGLEERYLNAKKTFLINTLSHLQQEIDSRGVAPDIGFMMMVLYLFEFIEKEVGTRYADSILGALAFTGWPLDVFMPILDKKTFQERVGLAVDTNYEYLDERTRANTIKLVSKIFRDFGLHEDYRDEIGDIIEENKALYRLIGSNIDLERREIVKRLAKKGGKKTPLKLFNIGIVPTEQCPNSCRFCLAPWKATIKERTGREVSDKEFKDIADQVIEFAFRHKIIITVTGGEPFLEMKRVLYLLENAKTRIDITTSGFWAGTKKDAFKVLVKLRNAARKNKNPGFRFSLQPSIDFFHHEMHLQEDGELKENVPLKNIANIIEVIQKRFKDIEVCPLAKYTLYDDPIVDLLHELEKRGLKGRIVKKVYNKNLKVSVMENGRLVSRPALLTGFIKFGRAQAIPVTVTYSAVEGIGKATALKPFEFPGFDDRTSRFLDGGGEEKFPVIGIEISDDGKIYPGAHSLYSWSVGNVLETPLEEVYQEMKYDPLIIALAENPQKIKEIALELKPDLKKMLLESSSPISAVFKIMADQDLRLDITKRLMENDGMNEDGPDQKET